MTTSFDKFSEHGKKCNTLQPTDRLLLIIAHLPFCGRRQLVTTFRNRGRFNRPTITTRCRQLSTGDGQFSERLIATKKAQVYCCWGFSVCRTKTKSPRTQLSMCSHPIHSQCIQYTAWLAEREPHFVVSLLWPYVCRYEKRYVVSAMKSAVVWPGAILSVSGLLLLDFENQRLNGLRYMLQEAKPKWYNVYTYIKLHHVVF